MSRIPYIILLCDELRSLAHTMDGDPTDCTRLSSGLGQIIEELHAEARDTKEEHQHSFYSLTSGHTSGIHRGCRTCDGVWYWSSIYKCWELLNEIQEDA